MRNEDLAAAVTSKMEPNITKRDQNILDLIFNSDSQYPQPEEQCKGELQEQSLSGNLTQICKNSVPADLLARIHSIEVEGIKAAEEGSTEKAIELFTNCISLWNKFASGYNNRAQAHRLLGRTDLAMEDLNKAIQYATEQSDKKILKQAYTQRGILHKILDLPDEALSDFQRGAQYGNLVAKMASVQENPYAKMCGTVLKEVMMGITLGSSSQEKDIIG